MNKNGYIKLYRSSLTHWLYTEKRPLTKREAWETILMTVNYEPSKTLIKGQIYECGVGQSLLSLESWGKLFMWSIQQVRTFFKLLQNDKMILVEGLQFTTRLTVCNWETYQAVVTDQQQTANRRLTRRQQTTNKQLTTIEEYKEIEEIKEDKELLDEPAEFYTFNEFWNDYDKKIGDKDKLKQKWAKISPIDRQAIKEYIPKYKAAQIDKKFRKNPETFLNNKSWNDEIIEDNNLKQKDNGNRYTEVQAVAGRGQGNSTL